MKTRVIKEFVDIPNSTPYRAEVYPNLRIGLLHAGLGDIITTPHVSEIYVVTRNSWENGEDFPKIALAFDPESIAEAQQYSTEVKNKYGEELREESGSGSPGREESADSYFEAGSGKLPGKPS